MIEAMCLGLPCVCTKVSGAIDLIEDGKNGLLVEIGDVDGLVERMSYLADNPMISQQIGQQSSELYKLLNKERINHEWMEFLKQN
jgi:glycosyltransferase involved in cell wall biosynthesis